MKISYLAEGTNYFNINKIGLINYLSKAPPLSALLSRYCTGHSKQTDVSGDGRVDSGYATAQWLRHCAVVMPLHSGYATAQWSCHCAAVIRLHSRHATAQWLCHCTVVMPLRSGHSTAQWSCHCTTPVHD